MLTVEEFNKQIANSNVLTIEMENIIIELDTTPSFATQANLNNDLGDLRNRIKNGDSIVYEGTGEKLTLDSFDEWVEDKLQSYSFNLYKKSYMDKK